MSKEIGMSREVYSRLMNISYENECEKLLLIYLELLEKRAMAGFSGDEEFYFGLPRFAEMMRMSREEAMKAIMLLEKAGVAYLKGTANNVAYVRLGDELGQVCPQKWGLDQK